ncbi:uncharacterized protein [Embiotoca jacksoni]|uniref:uncharacterized protein n=1 Tax=Embiotoca jacksoni TaxID=100190 RepID=UPI0037045B1D
MSGRLAFQTQLASIMEVLANAAVAEICKLVDDDYAVVSLQMSQCQRENKALKRKLHLLELKMARGNAERRLRESAMNSSRPRVQINSGDKLRESAPSSGSVFERQLDVVLWSGRAAAGEAAHETVLSEDIQTMSPDVELVEQEVLQVKEEVVEANMSRGEQTEEDVPLIGDDGLLESVPRGAAGQRQQDTQSASTQNQTQTQTQSSRRSLSVGSRGVEKNDEPDVVLVKVEEAEPVTVNQTSLSIQEGLVESSTDDYRGALPFEETPSNQLSDLQDCGRGFLELAAAERTPVVSEESSRMAAVQLKVSDTNTSGTNNPVSSEYSLFELETFFTRWAPDDDSAPCTNDDSAKCEEDGVIIVETQTQPRQALQPPRASGSSSSRQSFSSSSPGTSVSTALRMPAASQPPWSRAAGVMRGSPAQLLQHRNRIRCAKSSLSCSSKAPSVSGISSTVAPPPLPVTGSTAVLAGLEMAIAAQHRARLLDRHDNNSSVSVVPGDRRRKSYVCRACGKAFSGLSNLEAHERVHTGEKPFHCQTCGKRFSEAGNLKKHQRVHTGEKPFSCQQCGKRFAWICNLRTHQQSATGCGAPARGGLDLG